METASLIISSISLGIDITTIIGGFIKSNKTLNRLLDKAIKKAKRNANIDSQHLPGKPFDEKELNNILFDLVIKHAKGETIEIPNWLGDDFFIFYEAITQDVDFLEFLHQEIEKYQHSLQNEKLDEVNRILKEIRNQIELLSQQQLIENEKLDTIDETTKEIKEHVEKLKLPDWLVPYEIELSTNSKTAFLQDAHENLIRENKIYRKKDTIETITNWLDSKGICLIIAPEGRGKTFLSRIIAFDYHENDTKVYFVDCRKESMSFCNDMKSLLYDWNIDKNKKYLLVLENVHACSNPELLKQTIENQTKNQEEIRTNIKFLLNARPTIVDYDCFTNWGEIINLHPNENDVLEIVNLYQTVTNRKPFESEKKMMTFIKTISPNENDSNGTNLRLLSIYLRTWQNKGSIVYVSDVTEKDIYNDFIDTYGLNKTPNRDTVLLFISSLFQFDVPIPSKAVRQFLISQFIESPNLLNDIVIEGLLPESSNVYYLPHSVEAYFLFMAICYKQKVNYIEKTEEHVKFFVDDFILKQNNPRNYENEFRLLNSGLVARKEEFMEVIQHLRHEAKTIIMNLNPVFVFSFFRVENHNDCNELNTLINYYTENKDWLTSSIRELNPAGLELIYLTFNNHLHYTSIMEDIFKNPDDLRKYLIHQFEINNNITSPPRLFRWIRKIIERISPKHAAVLKEFYHRSNNFHKSNKYHFVSSEKVEYKILISNNLVHNKYCVYDKVSFQQFISDLCRQGLYLDELTWKQLNAFLKKMGDCIDETHKENFLQVAKALVNLIVDNDDGFLEKPNALERASSTHFSYFLFHLRRVDNNLYNDTISNAKIIKFVKQKLGDLTSITANDLYLFSRFYSQGWCKTKMNNIINKTDKEQLCVIKEWHNKVLKSLKKRGITMETGSMLEYIHNKFFIQQQNN